MQIQKRLIEQIPAIFWGEPSRKIILAVHGSGSSKSDIPIAILAEEAAAFGYQVLSFDLPEHGERVDDPTPCKAEYCVEELKNILRYLQQRYDTISLMANSIGAYFSLLAFGEEILGQGMFLSPVVDMQGLIENMMQWFDVSEERLCREQEIPTPMGQTLYWDYYQYVKNHPIAKWPTPTTILYGRKDTLCGYETVRSFAETHRCELVVSEQSEHYFHTPEDLMAYREWLRRAFSQSACPADSKC